MSTPRPPSGRPSVPRLNLAGSRASSRASTTSRSELAYDWRTRPLTSIHESAMTALEDVYRRKFEPKQEPYLSTVRLKYEALTQRGSSRASGRDTAMRTGRTILDNALDTPRDNGVPTKFTDVSQLGKRELILLQEEFVTMVGAQGKLTANQFNRLMGTVLDCTSSQLHLLFQQVDANADNLITWDELMQFMHATSVNKTTEQAVTRGLDKSVTGRLACHKGSIERICLIPELNYVASAGRDGVVQLWSASNLAHAYTLTPLAHLDSKSVKLGDLLPPIAALQTPSLSQLGVTPRPMTPGGHAASQASASAANQPGKRRSHSALYPTDLCWLAHARQLYVTSLDRTITVYDSRKHFAEVASHSVPNLPMCLDVKFHEHLNTDLVIVGDTHGLVTGYNSRSLEFEPVIKIQPHDDSVSRVKYYDKLGLVTCGMDGKLVLHDLDKWQPFNTLVGHKRNVTCFAYAPTARLLISGGFDRDVIVWNPYTQKPIWNLEGHKDSIVGIEVNEADSQIITIGADKVIKVWDMRRLLCVQTLQDESIYDSPDKLCTSIYDSARKRLLTGGSFLRAWPVEVPEKVRLMAAAKKSTSADTPGRDAMPAHSVSIIGVHYAPDFGLAVSVDTEGRVRVWLLQNGACVISFSTLHQGHVNASCLDHYGRRLFTVADDGVIKVWNYNTGLCLHVYPKRKAEISCVYFNASPFTSCPITIGGWDHHVSCYPDAGQEKEPHQELIGHTADVLAITTCNSQLVSGGADGRVLFWNMSTGRVVKKVALPETKGSRTSVVDKLVFLEKFSVLLVCAQDGSVHIVDSRTGAGRGRCLQLSDSVSAATATADDSLVLFGDVKGQLQLYDTSCLTDKEELPKLVNKWNIRHGDGVTGIAAVNSVSDIRTKMFLVSSRMGYLAFYSTSGEYIATLTQTSAWPQEMRDVAPHSAVPVKEKPLVPPILLPPQPPAQDATSTQSTRRSSVRYAADTTSGRTGGDSTTRRATLADVQRALAVPAVDENVNPADSAEAPALLAVPQKDAAEDSDNESHSSGASEEAGDSSFIKEMKTRLWEGQPTRSVSFRLGKSPAVPVIVTDETPIDYPP
eukprot:TRINITY_DN7870_c0_g1_i1.p1 TRINITY_DN7870_c0_g1~~TRINITY_DN7870_c0_g1_i1.p1  ORF type:complete len:1084 (+),score=205.12 TRINITY_DN7870_c0_g1_i1:81-3332(+)